MAVATDITLVDLGNYVDDELKNRPRLIRYFVKAGIWQNDATAKYYTGIFITESFPLQVITDMVV